MHKNETTRGNKSPTNSFIDFLGQNQNQNKAQKKSLSYDNFKLKKIRALYGKRVTMQLNESDLGENKNQTKGEKNKEDKSETEHSSQEPDNDQGGILHRLIIPPDSKWKSIFDVFVLFLVAYSCINSILNMTFDMVPSFEMMVVFYVVETFFYIDFILNFFAGFKDEE